MSEESDDDERMKNLMLYKMPITNREMESSSPVLVIILIVILIILFWIGVFFK